MLLGGVLGQPLAVQAVRVVLAVVWITFGLVYKILDLVPRHRAIVARVTGRAQARVTTVTIGVAEVLMGAWILTGRSAWLCMLLQTMAIAAMNFLELRRARDLLLAPVPMVVGNAVLLAAGWWAALRP